MEEIDFKKEIEAMKYFANKNAVSVFDIVHKECRVKEEDLRREGIMADMLNQEIQELQKEKQTEICENCKKQNNCNHKELIHRDDCRVNDCDYYCEVIPQEKRIEEMSEDVTRAVEYDIENSDLIDSCATAIKLIKLGWIKPNKDSVVLSKEEYEEYQKFKDFMERNDWENIEHMETTLDKCQEVLYERLQQASNETVEKILHIIDLVDKKYQNYAKEKLQSGMIAKAFKVVAKEIKIEISKQFNVKIKE